MIRKLRNWISKKILKRNIYHLDGATVKENGGTYRQMRDVAEEPKSYDTNLEPTIDEILVILENHNDNGNHDDTGNEDNTANTINHSRKKMRSNHHPRASIRRPKNANRQENTSNNAKDLSINNRNKIN